VRRKLVGEEPLPWEDENMVPRRLPEFGMLSSIVPACLARDPSQRLSSESLHAKLNNFFRSATTKLLATSLLPSAR
jgi:hypothetical protein